MNARNPLLLDTPPQPGVPLDTQELRGALGMFATGVTIVTARDPGGKLVGLTASSFNSVSLEPPLVLWSLSRQAASLATFSTGSHYAINVLAADQVELARRFATRGIDRYQGVDFREGAGGAPVLGGVAAWFECANRSQHIEGDHVIFVGQVERCGRSVGAQPLIYHGGRFFTELPIA